MVTSTRVGSNRRKKAPTPALSSRTSSWVSRPAFLTVLFCGLVAVVFMVYAATLNFQFVVDDHFFTGDPRIQSPGHVWEYFRDYAWAESAGGPANFYRPLFILWMRVNLIFNGLSPWGWHLLSIAKHAAVAVLLALLAWKLLRDSGAAIIAAILFALHPAQVESVAWTTVPDPLMSVGVLCTVLLYIRYASGFPEAPVHERKQPRVSNPSKRSAPSVFWLLASAATCLLTLFAKETAILLPAVMFALALFRPRGDLNHRSPTKNNAGFGNRFTEALLQMVPFVCATILYLAMRFHALGGKLSAKTQDLSLSTMVLSWPAMLWFYVKVLLWPTRSYAFGDPVFSEGFSVRAVLFPAIGVVLATAVLAVGLFWAWRKVRRDLAPEEGVGVTYALLLGTILLIFPLFLALDLNALSPGNYLHGRYTYLPLVGLTLLVAAGLRLTREYRKHVLFAGGIIGVVFAALTLSQEQQWRDDLTVLTVAHQLSPHNAVVAQAFADARVHYALQLEADGRVGDALTVLEQVTSEFPQDWFAWGAQADCFYHLDNLTDAEKSLHKAADLSQKPEVIQQWEELRAEMRLPPSD